MLHIRQPFLTLMKRGMHYVSILVGMQTLRSCPILATYCKCSCGACAQSHHHATLHVLPCLLKNRKWTIKMHSRCTSEESESFKHGLVWQHLVSSNLLKLILWKSHGRCIHARCHFSGHACGDHRWLQSSAKFTTTLKWVSNVGIQQCWSPAMLEPKLEWMAWHGTRAVRDDTD